MSKGEDTRNRILDRAMRVASIAGFEGLSIGTLAQGLDMSKSGVFAHFGSKEELQIAVLRAVRQRFIDAVLAPAFSRPRGEPRVRALFERWLDWEEGSVTPGGCPFIVASYEFDDRPGPVRDEVLAIQRELADALERTARLAVADGRFRSELDPRQFAFDLYGIVLSFHLCHRLLGRDDSRARARVALDALLERSRSSV